MSQHIYDLNTVAPVAAPTHVGDHWVDETGRAHYVSVGTTSAIDWRLVGSELVNAQTGVNYTYLTGDFGKLVTHTNAAAIAGTLPQAGTTFPSGWWVDVQNRGAGTLTITPTVSTVDGSATLALTTGQGARLVSDGTNYFTQRGVSGNSSVGSTIFNSINFR